MRVMLLLLVVLGTTLYALPASAQNCRKVRANVMGVSGADITVSTAPVAVLSQNTARCQAIITNLSANDMRCGDVTNNAAPTSTTAVVVPAGRSLLLTLEGQGAWACIRAGSADAVANVAESLP